jgi:hypothetical protein
LATYYRVLKINGDFATGPPRTCMHQHTLFRIKIKIVCIRPMHLCDINVGLYRILFSAAVRRDIMSISLWFRSFLTMLFLVAVTSGQIKWEKFYGDTAYDFSSQLLELSDHNFLICGYTYSPGAYNADIWLLKVKPTGDTLWTKTYGGKSYECATAVCELPDGNLLVAGNTTSFAVDSLKAAFDVWLLKLNSKGDTLWTKTFPGSNTANAKMIIDKENNIFLAANNNEQERNGDVQIIKCDLNGNLQWKKIYGKADYEFINSFQRTTDGSMLLLTTSQSFGAKTMWLFKLNSSGDTVWSHTYGNFNYGNGSDIIEMPDGTYMMSGYSGSVTQMPMNIYNLKTDGEIIWQKSYPEFASDYSPVFRLLSSGNFFISSIEGQERGNKIRLIRMDGAGKVLVSELMGDSGAFTYADDFVETSQGDFFMLGTTNKVSKAADDIWLVSLTPDMYVDLGGELKYRFVQNADSLNYSYKVVRGPTTMTISPGGTLWWSPQTSASSSEVVQVAIGKAAKIDTVGFVVNVNKRGNTTIRKPVMTTGKTIDGRRAVTLQINPNCATISSLFGAFRADIFTIQGKKIASFASDNNRSIVWNLSDGSGKKVPIGRYFVRLVSGMATVVDALTIMR